ncbi:MAG: metallophosphoesterase family protein [Pirellulaceae bacterium]
MKFIHAADLHIDSPLKGLESYEGAPLERLQGATRVGLENLVRLAVEHAVHFVIIAGDLFDGKWQDMHTGLWTAAQFRALERAGVRVFLLQGNHDAASRVPHAITWPSNVHVFSVERPETVILEGLKVAVHGQGFACEKISTDLAASYPEAVPHHFNIGVLHTSLTGNPEHDTYAATNLTVLLNRGYDYWALGHIHARSVPPLHELPYIAYSGNLQGRHIRETGAKGCLLVTVDQGDLTTVEFVATDTLRWQVLTISLDLAAGRGELLEAMRQQFVRCQESAEGRLIAARVVVRGMCELHRELTHAVARAELTAEIRNLASEVADDVWVEKIVFDTRPPVDANQLLQGKDLIGELLRSMHEVADDPAYLVELKNELKSLGDKASLELHEADVLWEDPRQLLDWLRQAEALLISRLTEDEL